jgi:membrane protein implicated in regulation of membrane protease activity
MRRIDVLTIGLGIFAAGGIVYALLQIAGVDSTAAGIWTQAVLVLGLLVWLATYAYRAISQNMTYNQQLKDYADAVLQKRLEELTPEELKRLQAEIEQEKKAGIKDEKQG